MASKEKKKGKPALTPAEKKAREEMLKNETKAQRFKRLGDPRVAAARKSIHLIGNLAGSGYEYTPEQVEKIRAILTDAVRDTLKKFEGKSAATAEPVSL